MSSNDLERQVVQAYYGWLNRLWMKATKKKLRCNGRNVSCVAVQEQLNVLGMFNVLLMVQLINQLDSEIFFLTKTISEESHAWCFQCQVFKYLNSFAYVIIKH